jgi:hypothetical protein
MGYYINQINGKNLNPTSKTQQLLDGGATLVSGPITFRENLVCVVQNGYFDAAAYAYSEEEMNIFLILDGRPKTWLIVPGADILSGYKE